MTVVICLCMNRPYQSYYFVPLVSFWYLIVYIVLALPPKVSATICEANPVAYLYIILKFIGLFAAITVLYLSEVINFHCAAPFSHLRLSIVMCPWACEKAFFCPSVSIQVFFQDIFLMRPWKALFVTSDDEIHEWWFRWSLDRYRFWLHIDYPSSRVER